MSGEAGRPFDALAGPGVRASVESLIGSPAGLCTLVDPGDEMFRYSLDTHRGSRAAAAVFYLHQGHQIFQTVREVAGSHFGGLAKIPAFLDFASGWGRFTRFLVRELPPGRVHVAELDASAPRFQCATFGVSSVESASDPEAFVPGREFSFILAASFFSHLPQETFVSWARRLFACLAPGGLFLFSVHGSELLDRPIGEGGIHFVRESETSRLDTREYGTSYVTERFVRAALGEATGGEALVEFVPRGLCAHQDLYAVTRREPGIGAEVSRRLSITPFPRGELDRFALREDGTLVFAGWVADHGGNGTASPSPPRSPDFPEVHLLRNGVVIDRREGSARWRFETPREDFLPDDLILIRAVNPHLRQSILGLGTLRTHPPFPDSGSASESETEREAAKA